MGKRKREKEGDKDHGEAEETDVPQKRMKIDESKVEGGGKINMACFRLPTTRGKHQGFIAATKR